MLKKISIAILVIAVIVTINLKVFAISDLNDVEIIDVSSGNTAGNTSGNTAGNNAGTDSGVFSTIESSTGNTAGNTAGNTTGNTLGNTAGNTTGNTSGNTAGNTTGNTGSSSYTNSTKLPQTGVDTSILFIIIISAISALFAYKKIQDYKD